MGRISGRAAIQAAVKKYGGSGVDFFQLKNDGDSAKVRLLHKNDEDLDLILVHEVEVDGKKKYIECLEENCPFCSNASIGQPFLRLFLSMYDYEEQKVKVWERGTNMVNDLLGFFDEYGDFNNRPYKIVRHGVKGDKKTSYQLFPGDKLPFEEEFPNEEERPKAPELYGKFVLQWTAEEMKNYIAGSAPVPQDRVRGPKENGPGF